ncbi:MAG: hypothetical protein WKF85_10920 [Chitinophagaceae bacterium]
MKEEKRFDKIILKYYFANKVKHKISAHEKSHFYHLLAITGTKHKRHEKPKSSTA